MEAQTVLNGLYSFAHQRPGMEPGNYGYGMDGWRNYRRESASVTRDLHDVRFLILQCELAGVSAEDILAGSSAFSGRLSITPREDGKIAIDYCTGQYFPTEYRKAVCAVLAQVLWNRYRYDFAKSAKPGETAGDAIRRNFRRMYGARIQRRWFD